MFCFKFLCLCLWTNLTLIKFMFVFYVFALIFSVLRLFVQMSPTKHSASKKSSKRSCTNSNNFKSIEADMAYNDCYKQATIIMERVVRLETLENTSIPEVFKERTWTKLLNPSGNVYEEIIQEFFSNATVDGDHINCWMRHKEFVVTRDSIQEYLEVRPPSQLIAIQYDDKLDSLEPLAELFSGLLKKKLINTIPFNAEMRTLAYVMIHNLYPVTNLTTLSGPKTIFLYDLYTHKEIDICGQIYHLLTKSITKRNTRTIMSFPTLIMGFIAKTRLKFPSGLTIVPKDYPIGANTMTGSRAHITGSKIGISQIPRDNAEEEGGDTKEEIDRFTSTPESSAQPSSQAQARGPDHLDRLMARVE